jgi:uncharacterized membrane protein
MDREQRGKVRWGARILGTGAALVLIGAALQPVAPYMVRAAQNARAHDPDWALWARLPPQVQIHILAAFAALVIGGAIFALPKGRGLHKPFGWAWVAAMAAVVFSSLFITGINGGAYSFIHLLTGWTLVALPLGVAAIRRKNAMRHRHVMTGLYYGGLIVAGALTFIPGRFMFQLFFG